MTVVQGAMAETSEDGGVPVKADEPQAAVIETGERSPPKDKGSEDAFEFDSSAASVRGSSLDDVEFRGGSSSGLRRDRPYSSSVISRRSTKSTQSRASLNPSLVTSDYAAKTLFAYRVRTICISFYHQFLKINRQFLVIFKISD